MLLPLPHFSAVLRSAWTCLASPEDSKPDFVLVEAQAYCRMLLEGDPKVVETLFVDQPLHFSEPLMGPLVARRRDFLTSHVAMRMLKDATSGRKLGAMLPGGKRQLEGGRQRQKMWYLVVRLLLSAREVLSSGDLSVPMREEDRRVIESIRSRAEDEQRAEMFVAGGAMDVYFQDFVQGLLREIEGLFETTRISTHVSEELIAFVETLHFNWRINQQSI